MAYICQDIEHRRLGKAVGSGQCVALVQAWCNAPNTGSWSKGIDVRGNDHLIQKGTAIATFENGVYPNRSSGNHAAIYLGQDASGIQVIDQWSGQGSHRRTIRWEGRGVSNDGDFFSVIE
jgi:hypothetical protein